MPRRAAASSSAAGGAGAWTLDNPLGSEGKEGQVFLARRAGDRTAYAMKRFKATKSVAKVRAEAGSQQSAADIGVAPAVVDVVTLSLIHI